MQIKQFHTDHFLFKNYIELTEEENRVIWEGRNHPDVRKWMENPEPFSFESHKKFVESLKTREDCIYWAVIQNNYIVGSYCINPYDKNKREGESGKYLMPEYQGKGLGKLITEEFISYIFSQNIVFKILAKTLISNVRNQRINQLMGFVETKRDSKYIYMVLNK